MSLHEVIIYTRQFNKMKKSLEMYLFFNTENIYFISTVTLGLKLLLIQTRAKIRIPGWGTEAVLYSVLSSATHT